MFLAIGRLDLYTKNYFLIFTHFLTDRHLSRSVTRDWLTSLIFAIDKITGSAKRMRYAGFIAHSIAALLHPALAMPQITQNNIAAFSDSLDKGEIRLGVHGFGISGGCSTWAPEGHGNWNVFQSCQPNNPTELQVYPNAADGIAQVTSGTNLVTLVDGTAFSKFWTGLPYFYYEGTAYKVESVSDSSHLKVQTLNGGMVHWKNTASGTYYFMTTNTAATCDVTGTVVTRTTGQPFIPFFDFFYINDIEHSIAYFKNQNTLVLSSSAGTLRGATCVQYKNINNELSTLRLQGLWGANEENFSITETPDGTLIQSTFAGRGKYRPIFIEDGENPAGTQQMFFSIRPNPVPGNAGTLGIGGDTATGNQVIQVTPNPSSVNYWLIQGGSARVAPSLACRGLDSSVGCGIDIQGADNLSVTSHSFASKEFEVFGNGGTSWLATGSSSSDAPKLSANGAATNINVVLTPKGAGLTRSTGPVQLPQYNVNDLPECGESNVNSMAAVADQNGVPAYRGSLTGHGHLRLPVFCGYDGKTYAWEAH